MAERCTFDPTDALRFPYEFKSSSGATITQGVPVNVAGYADPVCIFNTSCVEDPGCCAGTRELTSLSQVWWMVMIIFYAPFIVMQCMARNARQRKREKLLAQGSSESDINAAAAGGQSAGRPVLPGATGLVYVAMLAVVAAIIIEAVIMPQSIQQNLSPADRAAELAMSAFLTPIREIFQFLEDTMTVKVGYALAAGRLHELNVLLHVSVGGGAVSALLAFGLMLFVALYEPAAASLLNPSAAPNALLIDAGCPLLPTTAELLTHARIYWLLKAGAWLPAFVCKGIVGFFLGTRHFAAYGAPIVIGATVPVALWFSLLPLARRADSGLTPLSLLGIAYGTADWLNLGAFAVYFYCAANLRHEHQLKLLLCRGRALVADSWRVVREVVVEGLELMVVDLSVQLSLTCTIYLAASQSFETAYKLAAASAAYWQMGPSYLVGTMVVLKMFGAQMIAAGQYARFARIFLGGAVFVLALSVGAVAISALKRQPLAFEFGESACVFASDPDCAPAYARIFLAARPGDSLADVFVAFGPTVGLQMIFILLRAGLATCHDFAFLAKASFGALAAVYAPAILLAHLHFRVAAAYYLAMYLPHFALVVVFGVRMSRHLRAMLAATDDAPAEGPWSRHAMRMSVSAAAAPPVEPMAEPSGADDLERRGGDRGSMRAPLMCNAAADATAAAQPQS